MTHHTILNYSIKDEDLLIKNPYLLSVNDIIQKLKQNNIHAELARVLLNDREELIEEFSFSIPTIHILKKINDYSPIVEIGAGSGYWAYCLEQLGCDIICYDKYPPGEENPFNWLERNSWFQESWVNINHGDESSLSKHIDRALFMAWPNPESPMAFESLENYINGGGKTVLFIGDRGLTADNRFFNKISKFKVIHYEELMGWPGIREFFYIYDLRVTDQ